MPAGTQAPVPDAIEQRVHLPAPPDRVWRALSDRATFERWWGGPIDRPLAAGETIWLTHGERRYSFDVIEMVAPQHLVWRWHPGERNATVAYAGEAKTWVRFALAPWHDGTLLTVTETGFALAPLVRRPQAFADNVNGWLHQVSGLRAIVCD